MNVGIWRKLACCTVKYEMRTSPSFSARIVLMNSSALSRSSHLLPRRMTSNDSFSQESIDSAMIPMRPARPNSSYDSRLKSNPLVIRLMRNDGGTGTVP